MNRSQLLALASLVLNTACAHALSGGPVAGDGVRVAIKKAEVSGSSVRVDLVATNDLDRKVFLSKNLIAVVPPDGKSCYRTGKGEIVSLKAGGDKRLQLEWDCAGAEWGDKPGLFLRFDGVWLGTRTLHVPPLPLGNAPASAGEVSLEIRPPQEAVEEQRKAGKPSKGIFTRLKEGVFGKEGVEEYDGKRYNVRGQGTKIAAMPLGASGLEANMSAVFDDYLLTELTDSGLSAVGPDDINAMVGLDKLKQSLGSDDDASIAQLGASLGVSYLVAGKVAVTGNTVVVTLKLLDVAQKKVLARANKDGEGKAKITPRLLGEAVHDMLSAASL